FAYGWYGDYRGLNPTSSLKAPTNTRSTPRQRQKPPPTLSIPPPQAKTALLDNSLLPRLAEPNLHLPSTHSGSAQYPCLGRPNHKRNLCTPPRCQTRHQGCTHRSV